MKTNCIKREIWRSLQPSYLLLSKSCVKVMVSASKPPCRGVTSLQVSALKKTKIAEGACPALSPIDIILIAHTIRDLSFIY